jgi:tetratricopeptide (TPR) repeat protein
VPFYLAYIYHENGQDAKAISYGENYLKAGDGLHNSEMLQLLASIYFNKGDQQRAVLLYEKAIASGIVLNPVQRFELGSGYHFTGKFTKAAEDYVAKNMTTRIILIDGFELGRLLVKHEVGVVALRSYNVLEIDENLFDETQK